MRIPPREVKRLELYADIAQYFLYKETFEKPGDFHHPQKDDGLF
jgi:hypothetical protein